MPFLPLLYLVAPVVALVPPTSTPTPTNAVITGQFDDIIGTAPEPTPMAALMPRLDGYTMDSDTCGFVTSSWSEPIVCVASGYTCTNSGTYRGCCNDPSCSAIKTRCLDYSQSVLGSCTADDYHTVCCSQATAPYCYTYLFEEESTTYRALACDTTSGNAELLDYPPIATASGYSGSATDSGSVTEDYWGSLTSTSASTSARTTLGSSSSSSSSTTSSSKKSKPVGAIVGGVVGGVGAISILIAAILFYLRKKKAVAAPATAPLMSAAPPPTYSPPVQDSYTDAYGNKFVNGQLVAPAAPPPAVSPVSPVSNSPPPIELGNEPTIGTQGNRAELRS